MVEEIRHLRIDIAVDTNKADYNEEFDDLEAASKWLASITSDIHDGEAFEVFSALEDTRSQLAKIRATTIGKRRAARMAQHISSLRLQVSNLANMLKGNALYQELRALRKKHDEQALDLADTLRHIVKVSREDGVGEDEDLKVLEEAAAALFRQAGMHMHYQRQADEFAQRFDALASQCDSLRRSRDGLQALVDTLHETRKQDLATFKELLVSRHQASRRQGGEDEEGDPMTRRTFHYAVTVEMPEDQPGAAWDTVDKHLQAALQDTLNEHVAEVTAITLRQVDHATVFVGSVMREPPAVVDSALARLQGKHEARLARITTQKTASGKAWTALIDGKPLLSPAGKPRYFGAEANARGAALQKLRDDDAAVST